MVATVCGLLAFLGLVLVPPARCLFALSVPTLGTEQGRRLLLSWSTATLTIAVVPNILANLRATGQVLRCVTEGSLESLLNTTHWLQTASQALNPDGQAGSQGLTLQAQGDSAAAFRLHVLRVTQQVLEDFSGLESSARVVALGTQRVVTGLFMLGLLLDSAWYLHRYLTDLRFDNIYATRQLTQRLAEVGATHLTASPPAWLLWAAQPRLSQAELLSCLVRLGLFTLLLMAMAVTVAMDYVAFLLAQAAVDWARELPAVPVTLTIKYNVSVVTGRFEQSHFLEGNDCCCCLVVQSCRTVCDPVDCSTPPPRLLCLWDSPGKNTGVGCHFLLQGIFLTQGLNLHLLHCRQTLYHLSHQGSLRERIGFVKPLTHNGILLARRSLSLGKHEIQRLWQMNAFNSQDRLKQWVLCLPLSLWILIPRDIHNNLPPRVTPHM